VILERNVAPYLVSSEDTVATALQKIGQNRKGFVLAVSARGHLEGVLTDGDVRRWLLRAPGVELHAPVAAAMNAACHALSVETPGEDIARAFSERIRYIPLLDAQRRVVAVALPRSATLRIGPHTVSQDGATFVIAEIGNNHNGQVDLAYRLIDEAVAAGADGVKFQMRHLPALYGASNGARAQGDLGTQYTLDLLARFQLSDEDMLRAFDHCAARGVVPLCTPWDLPSLEVLQRYGMVAYKVASADLTNHDLLEALCRTGKPLICSTGMSAETEIVESARLLGRHGAPFALLHCNATYPAPFKDVHLRYLSRLQAIGGGCVVGYSGHERGIAVAIAAVAMGARIIEKHLTLDRTMEGNDHRVSLQPDEFAAMVRGIREVEESLGAAEPRRVSQGEMMNREVLGKSVVAACAVRAGERLTEAHLAVRSPGQGLPPYRKRELIDTVARRDMEAGACFFPSDLAPAGVAPRPYRFRRPFGVPVRHHDVSALAGCTALDLVEFHLSYRDLDLEPAGFLRPEGHALDLVVHAPELFAGDHLLDLSAADDATHARSLAEMRRVIGVAARLRPYFHRADRIRIVTNVGGFSPDGFLPREARAARYERVAASLRALDGDAQVAGVELIPQTMPPFPWHFGGQRYHNLFLDPEEIASFCDREGRRVCLDISHTRLAATHLQRSFAGFVRTVGPHVAHLHVADARGVDGEGLPIGEGEMDVAELGALLDEACPGVSFIPEVWQGHKNGGEGFWLALDRLERAWGPSPAP
jgi:N-acetylneuraminate synthase